MTLSSILELLTHYQYYLLFPALIVEGPTFTILASFLASPGGGHVMDVWTVFFVVVIADITGDTLYYLIGRFGKGFLIKRYPKRFSIAPDRLKHIEEYYKSHGAKTLIAGKLTHSFGWPAMVGAGSAHMPYPRFLAVNALVSIGKSIILVSLGYFYGQHYEDLIQYVGKTGLIVSTVVIILIIYFLVIRKREKEE